MSLKPDKPFEVMINILRNWVFVYEDEKELQGQVSELLNKLRVPHKREYTLGYRSIADFFLEDGTVVEFKLKGSAVNIYKQIERYTTYDECTSVILYTSKAMGMPPEINNKPIYYVSIGTNWL